MKIGFYADNLCERGTAVAIFDYAVQNQRVLGNETVVLYDKTRRINKDAVIARFDREFELIACNGFQDADCHVRASACDSLYVIKSGAPDDMVSRFVPTMVHAVFPGGLSDVHGSSYAFVSEWLSKSCTLGKVPWVPHIAKIGASNEDLREEQSIPSEALVFGCHGGAQSFDIDFVKFDVIPRVLEDDPSIWFVFLNIEPFIDHPRVVFLPATADVEEKTVFINTCDAMLHGRKRGETFGLAVAEFSLRDKPVLTYAQSPEVAHIAMLGGTAQGYRSAKQLYQMLRGFDRSSKSAKDFYVEQFAPEPVMARFAEHLIDPAGKYGINNAQKAIGINAFSPMFQVLGKGVAKLRGLT